MKLSTLLLSSLLMISMACNERKGAKPAPVDSVKVATGIILDRPNREPRYFLIGYTATAADGHNVFSGGEDISLFGYPNFGEVAQLIEKKYGCTKVKIVGISEYSQEDRKEFWRTIIAREKKKTKPLKIVAGTNPWKSLPGDLYSGDNGETYVVDDSGRSILIKGGKPASPVTFKIDSTWRRVPPEEPYHPIIKKIIYPDSSWIPIKSQKTSKFGYKTVDSLIGYTNATIIIYKGEGGKRMADTIYRSSGIGITLDSVGIIFNTSKKL